MNSQGNIHASFEPELTRARNEHDILSSRLPIRFESTHSSNQEKGGSYGNLEPQEDVIEIRENTDSSGMYLLNIYGKNSGVYRVKNVPVEVSDVSCSNICFRGCEYEEESFFGSRKVDGTVYGLDVFFDGDTAQKAVFHRYDLRSNCLYVNQDCSVYAQESYTLDGFMESMEDALAGEEDEQRRLVAALEEKLRGDDVLALVDSSTHKDIIAEGLILGLMKDAVADRERAAEIALYCLTDPFIGEGSLEGDDRVAVYLDLYHLFIQASKDLRPLLDGLIHKADNPEESFSDSQAYRIASSVIELLSYLSEKVIEIPLNNSRGDYLDTEEIANLERVRFVGQNKGWFRLGEDTSTFILLREEVARKYSQTNQ